MSSSDGLEVVLWIIAVPIILLIGFAQYYCKKERRTQEINRGIRRYQEQNARQTTQQTSQTTTTTSNYTPTIRPPYRPTLPIYTVENDTHLSNNSDTVAGRNMAPRLSIISNNGLPPSYEEAIKLAPINKPDNDNNINQT